ncbi:MAG: sigma-70 family RNA polymerase sigma factor [Endomicrobium sp.]|jgi:RNA polymerase sigma-70 factor (ECF subfamily)|nr:sigma-70 family RNA polymerase sigma factor [Endomicrobium sp.]
MLSDLDLIKFVREGKQEAFEAFIIKYKDKVYNIAFSFTGNHSESDDIAQNVFFKIYLNLNSFEGKSSFSTWLYRITVNECYNGLRKRKNNILSLDFVIKEDAVVSLKDIFEDKNVNIEDFMMRKEMQLKVRKAIIELPYKYRMIVTLRDIEDMSYEEISKIMKISQDKVKVWLFRARSKLKNILRT